MTAVLAVDGLSVTIDGVRIVSDISLRIDPGECVALVGASGSGKTVTARALLGISADRAVVDAGRLEVAGTDARTLRERGWRKLRGASVGYVGQEALGALDPLRPVGREVGDAVRLHTSMTAAERVDAVRAALEGVGLDPEIATDGRLAGTLSGGMRQRALIAAATIGSPALVVADEPTTALDAGVAVTVMEQLRRAQRGGAGLLVITHDLGLVSGWADRVVVVSGGRIVEQGPVARVFSAPEHPATAALVHAARAGASGPATRATADTPDTVVVADRLDRHFDDTAAVRDVSFALDRGRVLGVIGASGSGKTTLARILLGLETPDAGSVTLDGAPWAPLRERDRRARRHRVAAVVQDPGATFDERWDVERVLADAFSRGAERRARGDLGSRVDAALRQVGLDPALRSRSPLTLSGGQRQRLAIARSLATEPEVLVLDEPVTALDATVQDAVLGLLERLRDETGVAMVFVSHDLRAVRRMADDVLVVHEGAVVEHGPAATVLARPAHPVTARLLHAAEVLATGPAA
ncbi:ATP-binding cassette domain-containing protein [Curtobacterium sp. NPDC089689]|uniref:ATP-binding cassette domain-containing protein n=1 Tax=Curtobacterium sp. NPDC089689 TaxID=3363968 RepID=UPI0037F40209